MAGVSLPPGKELPQLFRLLTSKSGAFSLLSKPFVISVVK